MLPLPTVATLPENVPEFVPDTRTTLSNVSFNSKLLKSPLTPYVMLELAGLVYDVGFRDKDSSFLSWFFTEISTVLEVIILSELVAVSVYVVVSVVPAVRGESLPCVDLGGVTVI